MKNRLARAHSFTRFASRLVARVLFASFFLAAPFHGALAADEPNAATFTISTVTGDVGSPTAFRVTINAVEATDFPAGDRSVIASDKDFLYAYDRLSLLFCDKFLKGDLGGWILPPGVYCVEGASTTTNGTLTLSGSSEDIWIFKIGTSRTGALTGINFSVVMDGGGLPSNVYWWVPEAVTMSTSNFKGNILTGATANSTGGSLMRNRKPRPPGAVKFNTK